jgi:hypothetical protein
MRGIYGLQKQGYSALAAIGRRPAGAGNRLFTAIQRVYSALLK